VVRSRERRVAEAVTAYLARAGQHPEPRALAQVVGAAAGAASCALVIDQRRYQWGEHAGPWLEHDISYGDEVVGTLAVAPESVRRLPAVAAVLGPPVATIRMAEGTDRLRRDGDAATRALVDERWRAAAEMELQRRGLERDLHDGAQHNLVALRMSLALLEHEISAGKGRERVPDLLAQLATAERVLVHTAAGILPGVLVANGVAVALRTEMAKHGNVTFDATEVRRRYPTPVESAVYFVVLEAVNNARKHAPGARIVVALRDNDRGLEFTVADDGPGFSVATPNGGLSNLAMRAASVGGTIEVHSQPGAGTTVRGVVPL
jgi:signal transduction histidine kinase